MAPGYVAEPGYVEPGYVEVAPDYVDPGYVEAAPGYVPVDPGYAVALAPTFGPDCYWRRGPLGRLRSWCD
ncbi:MAG: hypothetical protein ACRECX_05270 [Methyloceanibacter sp.]|uniref:hypothetical protein n=1 Tax=Methyloceanibacter sp. TaxID=1965321 RepID=UPI003D6CEBEA